MIGKSYRINSKDDLEEIFPVEVKNHPSYYYFPDDPRVAVSKTGSVINLKTNKILKGRIAKCKSIFFIFTSPGCKVKSYRLHRLLARTFIGRPSRHLDKHHSQLEVNHCDGNRFNNSLDNLEWVTGVENINHSHLAGLHSKDKPVIARCLRTGHEIQFHASKVCADHFNIKRVTFWKHLNKGYSGQYHKNYYVFKYVDDDREWPNLPLSEIKELGIGGIKRLLKVKDFKDNKIYIFDNLKKIALKYNIPMTKIWRKISREKLYQDTNVLVEVIK